MKRYTDEEIDRALGMILRSGVIAAATLVLIGGILFLAHPNLDPQVFRVFHGAPPELTHVHAVIGGALGLRPLLLIQLGLLVLIATPVIRVIACAVGFGIQHDWTYVVVSLIVLTLLLVSLSPWARS